MKRTAKYTVMGLAFWFLLFLGWEWWHSFPKVRVTPISFPENDEAKIDSLLSQSLSHFLIPGLAVGIITNEKVTYLKAFGYKNLESKDSLTLQSLIPVASVSKLFTALTLSNYSIEKGIAIDTSINSILPAETRLAAEYDGISLKDLLNHTSGLTDKRGLGSLFQQNSKRELGVLPSQIGPPTLHQKQFQYADVNFDLIGYLLEVLANKPFAEVAKERILQTSGMGTSQFITAWPLDSIAISGYQRTFLWKRIEEKAFKLERIPSPSSGLVLSAADLSKALLHLSRENMGIFGDELTWLKGENRSPAGFQSIRINDMEFIGHFGGQGGYSSLVIYSPDLDLALFLLSNAQDKAEFRKVIAEEVLKIVLK
jgi:CubicO group peptidase (beta-lactamase class C family)